ncbi:MAG: hypothetical protein K2V38_01985 [Gemmataceae bacterium]|nr:hypothetical protein [Gemmataceae bacterium]
MDYAPPVAPAAPDLGGLILKLVLMTLALVALCVGVVWFARRANRPVGVTGKGKGDGKGDGRLVLQGTLALDRLSAVHLVAVDGQTVAVTTDASGLRGLVLLSEPFQPALDAAEQAQADGVPEGTPGGAPAQEVHPAAPPAPKPSADDVRQLLERLVRRGQGAGVHLEPALRDDQP